MGARAEGDAATSADAGAADAVVDACGRAYAASPAPRQPRGVGMYCTPGGDE